jgi:hypothetical protein
MSAEHLVASSKVVAFTIILTMWRRQTIQWKDVICTYNNSRYIQNWNICILVFA